MNSEVPARFNTKLWAYFAVGFTLPLVLTNGQEAKLLGALAPLTCHENTKKMRLKPASGLVFYPSAKADGKS